MKLARQSTFDSQILVCTLLASAFACIYAANAPAQTATGQVALKLDPAKSSLHWTLGSTLHTVHGTFNLKSGTMQLNPADGSASGEFVAYASSGESGNEGRDKKMHKEILESARFPDIVFRPSKIDGSVALQGSCDVKLQGAFLLHGSQHEITIPVHAELSGSAWKATAMFSIPYVSWGLKSPNTFLLKADPAVQIELELTGSLQRTTAP